MNLHFNTGLMEFLAGHRDPVLTAFFQSASFLGEIEGYILVVMFVYVAVDKTLAVRLSVLVLLTMTFNHLLKVLIRNPRPFVSEGTFADKWAVSPERARDLVTEFSTPSGHAMAGSAFYGYLFGASRSLWIKVAAVLAILATGLSRPYVGVHYLEDILIGWAIGLAIAIFALRTAGPIAAAWARLPYGAQAAALVVASFLVWLATLAASDWRVGDQPRAVLAYLGLLAGVVLARPIELKLLNFDPRSGGWLAKLARYALSLGITIASLALLEMLFDALADRFSIAGYVLQYVRYVFAGVIAIFVCPLICSGLKLVRPALSPGVS